MDVIGLNILLHFLKDQLVNNCDQILTFIAKLLRLFKLLFFKKN